jgi:LPS export ABC transporter permease LptG/LPS export ABC transporter permease LptF
MKTLDRYVIREILPPLLLSLLIFTFILEIPPVMEQLESLVSKGVSWTVAGRILITLIPQALGLTIPMALLVGLLIGLGRLSGDREAVALLACGVSPYRLLRPVLALTAVAVAVHLYVMIRGIPDANQTFREITYEVVSKRVENDVRPQVFFDDFPGWVLYARDVPPAGGGWRDVLVADTRGNTGTTLYLARSGRLILDRVKQTVDLVLIDGTRYSNTGPEGRQIETYRFPRELIVSLDPKTVFPRMEIQRGINELSLPDLMRQADDKRRAGLSPHAEVMAIQQKFSFPMANVVFAIIGLALGLSVAREGKVAGFVIGIVVIFGYYILLYLCESLTKGHFLEMHLSRWVPNLLLLPFGIVALIWRARWAEGRKPFGWLDRTSTRLKAWWTARQTNTQEAGAVTTAASAGARQAPRSRKGVLIVVRVPRLTWLSPNILDRYISRIYLKTAAISFAALLGIFYIATFIDRSDKLFKGQATTGMLMQLLALMTPQFIYYVIPIAALLGVLVTFGVLSRTSELSVIKACGVSIYRLAAPLMVLSLVWSGTLFSLEQRIMALANRKADALDSTIRGRPPRTFNALSRRWLVGHDGGIYHYSYFDPQKQTVDQLAIYQPSTHAWSLESQTFVKRAVWSRGEWTGLDGWRQGFEKATWDAFDKRPLPLETPDYFETEQPVAELMTVPQLKNHIDELSASGFNIVPLTVDLQKKLAFPFVTFVMTLLAIPFGLTTGKRGTLYGIGIGIVLALSYWTLSSAFAAIGKAGLLDPILAGWAPNVITAGSAAYLLLTTRT